MSKQLFAKFMNPNAGWPGDVERAKELLTLGETYEVERVSMGQSNTNIYLKGMKYGLFNSAQFDFYGADKKPLDIFKDPEFNPYLMMGRDFDSQP